MIPNIPTYAVMLEKLDEGLFIVAPADDEETLKGATGFWYFVVPVARRSHPGLFHPDPAIRELTMVSMMKLVGDEVGFLPS